MTSTGKHSFQTLWQEQKILEILLQFLSFFFSSNQRLNKSKRFIYLNFCMHVCWLLLCCVMTPESWCSNPDTQQGVRGKNIFIWPITPVKVWALIWTHLDSNLPDPHLTLTWLWDGQMDMSMMSLKKILRVCRHESHFDTLIGFSKLAK